MLFNVFTDDVNVLYLFYFNSGIPKLDYEYTWLSISIVIHNLSEHL